MESKNEPAAPKRATARAASKVKHSKTAARLMSSVLAMAPVEIGPQERGRPLRYRKPKYVDGFVDRFGHPRFYFRRDKRSPRIPLPGLPNTPVFMAAYEACLNGQPAPAPIASPDMKAGSFKHYMVKYIASPKFATMEAATKYRWKRALENFAETLCADGKARGSHPVARMDRFALAETLDALESRHTAAQTLKAMRGMFAYLEDVERDINNPTLGCKITAPEKTDGYYTWSEDDIIRFAKHHPINTQARLAMALMLYTGLRLSDALKLGPQNIRRIDGVDRVQLRPHKTKKSSGFVLDIPVHPALAKTLAANGPFEHSTFLTSQWGRPFSPGRFSQWMRKWVDDSGIAGDTTRNVNAASHGLRKAGCVRLANLGLSVTDIAAITGHKNLRVLAKYVEAYDKAKASARSMKALIESEQSGDLAMGG